LSCREITIPAFDASASDLNGKKKKGEYVSSLQFLKSRNKQKKYEDGNTSEAETNAA
jgi:hypothetical protein